MLYQTRLGLKHCSLPTLDVDAVVSSLELSLKLPVCLDPRVAPSQGVVQCTYVNWFLPSQAKFRSCYFPAAAHRVQKFLAFKLGCHGLPAAVAMGLGNLGQLPGV